MRGYVSLSVLIFMGLLIQGCEVSYISKIIIKKDYMDSADAQGLKNEEPIKKAFDGFCSMKRFPYQKDKYFNLDKGTEIITQCGKAWFYNVRLWKKQDSYEIELELMQPWSLWHSGKQERFFCSETSDMFDYFRAGLMYKKATYKPYASCLHNKAKPD